MIDLFEYKKVDSTQNEAIRLLEAGRIDKPSIVSTNIQTNGRGRHGRNWQGGSGNILLTLVLPYEETYASWMHKGATIVKNFIEHHVTSSDLTSEHSSKVQIKAPNDVMMVSESGKLEKVAGVLVEVHASVILVGIGINIETYPDPCEQPTTCLLKYASSRFQRRSLKEWQTCFYEHLIHSLPSLILITNSLRK